MSLCLHVSYVFFSSLFFKPSHDCLMSWSMMQIIISHSLSFYSTWNPPSIYCRCISRPIPAVPDRGWNSNLLPGNFFRSIFGHRRSRGLENLSSLQRYVLYQLLRFGCWCFLSISMARMWGNIPLECLSDKRRANHWCIHDHHKVSLSFRLSCLAKLKVNSSHTSVDGFLRRMTGSTPGVK